MQELIQKIVSTVGISEEQAKQAVGVMSQFVKDKFPAAGGMIDQVLGGGSGGQQEQSTPGAGINLGGFKI